MEPFYSIPWLTACSGMFLWVRLVISGLLAVSTIQEIEDTLGNLPIGLEQTLHPLLASRVLRLTMQADMKGYLTASGHCPKKSRLLQ
jgi:hypothetical protein